MIETVKNVFFECIVFGAKCYGVGKNMKISKCLHVLVLVLLISVEGLFGARLSVSEDRQNCPNVLLIGDDFSENLELYRDLVFRLTRNNADYDVYSMIQSDLFDPRIPPAVIFDGHLPVPGEKIDLILLFKDTGIADAARAVTDYFPNKPLIITGFSDIAEKELNDINELRDTGIRTLLIPHPDRMIIRFIADNISLTNELAVVYNSAESEISQIHHIKKETSKIKHKMSKVEFLDISNSNFQDKIASVVSGNSALYISGDCYYDFFESSEFGDNAGRYLKKNDIAIFVPRDKPMQEFILGKCEHNRLKSAEEIIDYIDGDVFLAGRNENRNDTLSEFRYLINEKMVDYLEINTDSFPENTTYINLSEYRESFAAFIFVIAGIAFILAVLAAVLIIRKLFIAKGRKLFAPVEHSIGILRTAGKHLARLFSGIEVENSIFKIVELLRKNTNYSKVYFYYQDKRTGIFIRINFLDGTVKREHTAYNSLMPLIEEITHGNRRYFSDNQASEASVSTRLFFRHVKIKSDIADNVIMVTEIDPGVPGNPAADFYSGELSISIVNSLMFYLTVMERNREHRIINTLSELAGVEFWVYNLRTESFYYPIRCNELSDKGIPRPDRLEDIGIKDNMKNEFHSKMSAILNRTVNEFRFRHDFVGDGEETIIEFLAGPGVLDTESPGGAVIGITRNIREEVIMHDTMMSLKRENESLDADSAIANLIIRDDRVVDCNAKAAELFRCSKSELIGKHPGDMSTEYQDDNTPSSTMAREAVEKTVKYDKGYIHLWKNRRFDGEIFYSDIYLNAFKRNNKTHVRVSIIDISGLKREYDNALAEKESVLQGFRQVDLGVMYVNTSYEIERINSKMYEITGLTPADFFGRNPLDAILDNPDCISFLADIRKISEMESGDYDYLSHKSDSFSASEAEGKIVFYSFAVRDAEAKLTGIYLFATAIPKPSKENPIQDAAEIMARNCSQNCIITDNHFLMKGCSESVFEEYEIDPDKIENMRADRLFEHFSIDYQTEMLDFSEVIATGKSIGPVNCRIKQKSGKRTPVALTVDTLRTSDNEIIGARFLFEPLAEAKSQDSDDSDLASEDDTAPFVIILNSDSRIRYANGSVLKRYGFKSEEVIGEYLSSLIHADNSEKEHGLLAELKERATGNGQQEDISFAVMCISRDRNETRLLTAWNAVIKYDKSGNMEETRLFGLDISEYLASYSESVNLRNNAYKVMNSTHFPIVIFGNDGKALFINKHGEEMVGKTQAQLSGVLLTDFMKDHFAGNMHEIIKSIRRSEKTGESFPSEKFSACKIKGADAFYRIEGVFPLIYSLEAGKILITFSKQEPKINFSDEIDKLKNVITGLLDAVPDRIAVTYFNDRANYYNQAYYQALRNGECNPDLGIARHEVAADKYEEIERLKTLQAEGGADRIEYEYSISLDGGAKKTFRNSESLLNISDEKEPAGKIIISRDITKETVTSEKLEYTTEMLSEYTKNLESLVEQRTIELVERNEILEKNKQHLTKLQDSLVESQRMAVPGRLISGIIHEINSPLGAIGSSNESAREFLETVFYKMPGLCRDITEDSSKRLTELFRVISEKPVRTLSGKEKREIRDKLRRELAEKLPNGKDTDKIAEVAVMAGIENEIDNFLDLMKIDADGRICELVGLYVRIIRITDNIGEASRKTADVITALRKYIRKQTEKAAVGIDIRDSIESVLRLYTGKIKNDVVLEKKFQENLPEIYAFPDELNQVWSNLTDNALQAMNYSGTLTLELSNENGEIIVKVSDTGSGIPEDKLPRIFEPFYTTKDGADGTGLGLDIVSSIIEKHSGRIDVDSVVGKGTVFTVRLPLDNGLKEQDWKD